GMTPVQPRSGVRGKLAENDVRAVFEDEIGPRLQEFVRRNAASTVIVIIVEQYRATRTETVAYIRQAILNRIVPVAVDMGESDRTDGSGRQRFFEQSFVQPDRRMIDLETKSGERVANFVIKIGPVAVVEIVTDASGLAIGDDLVALAGLFVVLG